MRKRQVSRSTQEAPSTANLVVAALGYEQRSRFIPEREFRERAGRRVAIAFPDRHALSYDENARRFRELGFEIVELRDPDFLASFEIELNNVADDAFGRGDSTLAVFVDISSFSRLRLALIIEALCRNSKAVSIQATFFYAPAVYEKWDDREHVITACGPVTAYFAGWPSDLGAPLALVIGLGYEDDRAIGLMEYLDADPRLSLLFEPTGVDRRYDQAVRRANRELLAYAGKNRVVRYSVGDCEGQFDVLESLLFGLQGHFRPLVVPFGPKMFALCGLLTASIHDWAGVWRVSPGAAEPAVERIPTGQILRLSIAFDRPAPAEFQE